DDFNRLWRMRYCWQLGVLFSFLIGWGLAKLFGKFWLFWRLVFERLGNVLACKGLAFLVKA
ncbi:MAG: hypothetical protein DRI89_13760, partial [Bacteroidetes bacterium]